MYAITEVDVIQGTEFEFQDGSFFTGTVGLGVDWDGDWKLQWVEGILADAEDNQIQFTSDTEIARSVIRKLGDEIAFRRRATDWAEEAIQEHKAEADYWAE